MNVRWLTTGAAFLLLAVANCPVNIITQQGCVQAAVSPALLRFGQVNALSDFDDDGLIDEATIDGSSFHKSVRILLSGSRNPTFLHLYNRAVNLGSLFARDIDNDGATDLIWTDLLRASNVIVWLGDGGGQFERGSACELGRGFTLGETNVAAPAESNPEPELNCENHPLSDYAFSHGCSHRITVTLPRQNISLCANSSGALRQPTDRGPPLPLS